MEAVLHWIDILLKNETNERVFLPLVSGSSAIYYIRSHYEGANDYEETFSI